MNTLYNQAGKAAGFRVNFHGDELNPLGGAEMVASIQAEAISHLEEVAILMLSESDAPSFCPHSTNFF